MSATLVDKAPLQLETLARVPNAAMPDYCPVCGRSLRYVFWDTTTGDYRYHLLLCYGDRPKSITSLLIRFIESPFFGRAHYRYEWGPTDNFERRLYDAKTGARLDDES